MGEMCFVLDAEHLNGRKPAIVFTVGGPQVLTVGNALTATSSGDG
jgi:hypothetical protein